MNQHYEPEKKKALRKVRTHFVYKKPENERNDLISVPKLLDPNFIHMIDPSGGLVEKNRKMHLSLPYLNSCLKINDIRVSDSYGYKTVTLSIGKPDLNSFLPLEYNLKRLESFGDLELATWAQKLRKLYQSFPIQMKKYISMIESGDQETHTRLEMIKLEIQQAQKEIESTHPYTKMSFRYDQKARSLVSIEYNQRFLDEIGQTAESLSEWVKFNGIPGILEDGLKIDRTAGRGYLEINLSEFKSIEEGPEVARHIYDINGCKKKVLMQCIRTIEPMAYGFLTSVYVVLKNSEACEHMFDEKCIISSSVQGECDSSSNKFVKNEDASGN